MANFRDWAAATARMVVTAVVTSGVIIIMLTLAYSAQTTRDEQRNAQLAVVATTLVQTNQAVACELALPVGVNGRNPADVAECFSQYGLDPPTTLNK